MAAARYAALAAESAAWYAESLRCIEEDKEGHMAEKAALVKKLADEGEEGKEGKE